MRFSAFLGAALLVTALIQGKRRVEESRREIDAQYRAIADTARDAIISIDASSLILFMNPATTRIFGWAASDLIGQPLTISCRSSALSSHCPAPLSGAEWIGRRKDGTEFPAEVSFGEVAGGDQSVFTGFVRDISERKRAEATLRKSETYWSAEMYRIKGLPPGDNPPSTEEIGKLFAPEVWAGILEMFETALREKIKCDGEFPMILPDGSNRMIRIVGNPVLDAAGDIVEFVGTTILRSSARLEPHCRRRSTR